MFTILTVALFAALMIRAAVSDIRHYILSNRLCLLVAGLYPFYLLFLTLEFGAPSWSHVGWSVALAALLFLVGVGLFALNVMGGGDVKLIPAVSLWAGPGLVLDFLVIMSLTGGLLAAGLLAKVRLGKTRRAKTQPDASKLFKSSENINLPVAQLENVKVPYGVGIALGGLYVALQLLSGLSH